jgi:hypothetical protein
VKDIGLSAEFYRDNLEFTVAHQDGSFAIIIRDAVEVHLWAADDDSWRARSNSGPVVSGAESFIAGTASCRLRVEGIDELYARMRSLGIVHPNAQLGATSWGTREFGVLDLDNNLVTLFERSK